MKLSFDSKADVLYCSFGDPREAIGVEIEEGVVLRLDPETDEVVGVTVSDFLKRFAKGQSPISLPLGRQTEAPMLDSRRP